MKGWDWFCCKFNRLWFAGRQTGAGSDFTVIIPVIAILLAVERVKKLTPVLLTCPQFFLLSLRASLVALIQSRLFSVYSPEDNTRNINLPSTEKFLPFCLLLFLLGSNLTLV